MYPTLIALLFTAKLFMIFLLILIACLSSTSFARQETAAGCLRDIVRVMKYRRETSEELRAGNALMTVLPWSLSEMDGVSFFDSASAPTPKSFAPHPGAEPDIFIWGGHWRGQFCNKGGCQCSV